MLNARPLWVRLLFRELGRYVPTLGVVFRPAGAPPSVQAVCEAALPEAPGWALHEISIPRRSLGRLAALHSRSLHRTLTSRFGPPGTVVFTQPSQRALCRRFEGVYRIYYAGDDYRQDYGWEAQRVETWERDIAANVERIVCVSKALAQSMAHRLGVPHEKLFVSANGMPESMIPTRAAEWSGSPPEERPLAGVFGTIGKRVRLDWLRALIDALPWLHLVLVGPREPLAPGQQEDLAYLANHPRCSVVDGVDYYELFRYAAGVRIGLLPLTADGINPTSSPVRFFTQLPFGQPIVASESSLQLHEFEPLVTIVKTLPEFIRKVDELKDVGFDDRLAETRRTTARRHTWERRAESLYNELMACAG